MYCPNCGANVGSAKFCPNCGTAMNQPLAQKPDSSAFSSSSPTLSSSPNSSQNSSSSTPPSHYQTPTSSNGGKRGCLIAGILIAIFLVVFAIVSVMILSHLSHEVIAQEPHTTSQTSQPTVSKNTESPSADPEESALVASEKASGESPDEELPSVQEPYSAELGSGHYTAGIDIPAGTYQLTAVKGRGNVMSSNMFSGGINAIMGISDSDLYIKEFKNLKLPAGETLSISGVVVKMESDHADTGGMKARENDTAKEVTLSNGHYIAGTDFEAGTYDITLVKGNGNVMSDNMFQGGLNVIMGDKDNDMYIQSFQNAVFDAGNELTISGCTIKLTPSE